MIETRAAMAGLKVFQDGILYAINMMSRVGRMVMEYHLLCEKNSKKLHSNILGEGTKSQWGELITFI